MEDLQLGISKNLNIKSGGSRVRLTTKQKSDIVEFIVKNPKLPLAKIARIFSAKYGQNVSRPVLSGLKKDMDKYQNVAEPYQGFKTIKSKVSEKFVNELYIKINEKLSKFQSVFQGSAS